MCREGWRSTTPSTASTTDGQSPGAQLRKCTDTQNLLCSTLDPGMEAVPAGAGRGGRGAAAVAHKLPSPALAPATGRPSPYRPPKLHEQPALLRLQMCCALTSGREPLPTRHRPPACAHAQACTACTPRQGLSPRPAST